MKSIITILLLFLTLQLSGQILPGVVASQGVVAAGVDPYDVVYAALDAVGTPPGTDTASAQRTMWNRIVDTCDMDVFYLFANTRGNGGQLINWVDPGTFDATDGNSTTWTTKLGYTGDDATDFIDLNFRPETDAINITDNSATLGTYQINQASANDISIGATTASPGTTMRMYPRVAGANQLQSIINCSTPLLTNNSTSAGLSIATRRAATDIENYQNSTSLGSAETATGNGLVNIDLYVLARNNDGTADLFSANTIAVAFVCEGLTDEQVAEVTDAIEDYMDYIGTGVIP